MGYSGRLNSQDVDIRTHEDRACSFLTHITVFWLQNIYITILVNVCTMYALLADDIRLAATSGTTTDIWFDSALFTCIMVFVMDIIAHVARKSDYVLTFDFLAASLSTISLLADLTSISESFIYTPVPNRTPSPDTILLVGLTGGKQLRLIRVVRTIERSYLFKRILGHISGSWEVPVGQPGSTDEDEDEIDRIIDMERLSPQLARLINPNSSPRSSMRSSRRRESAISSSSSRRGSKPRTSQSSVVFNSSESKVGTQLSQSNTRKVGVLIILCASLAPLVNSHDSTPNEVNLLLRNFDSNLGKSDLVDTANTFSGDAISRIAWVGFTIDSQITAIGWNLTCSCPQWPIPLSNYVFVSLLTDNPTQCPEPAFRRSRELSFWKSDKVMIILDERESVQLQGIFGLIQITFTILLMLILSVLFNSDCNKLLLIPMHRLVGIMRSIQMDPLCANTLIDKEMNTEIEYRNAKNEYETGGKISRLFTRKPKILQTESYREIATLDNMLLEQTILKFGSLLVVGFGEAGASLVGGIIRNEKLPLSHFSSGIEAEAVFGYIGICDFDTVTDVLEDGIVMLVNQLAEIVHGIVDEYGGFTVRNNGNSFSLIWKLPIEKDSERAIAERRRVCDLALLAMADIQIAIHKAPALSVYCKHPHLMMRLPGYRVRLRSSLHVGTAIAGAVGSSDFKIEASFLGTDIVWTQKLMQLGNDIYNVPIILSSAFVGSLSQKFSGLCRHIDIVVIQGEQTEAGIFTFDMDLEAIRICQFRMNEEFIQVRNPQLREYYLRDARKRRRERKADIDNNFDPSDHFASGDGFIVRHKYISSNAQLFYQIFKKCFLNYLCGEWEISRRSLRQCILFWVTHNPNSSNRLRGLTDANTTRRRTSIMTTIQTSTDEQLANMPHDMSLVDGPSLAMLKLIITQSFTTFDGHRKI